MIKFPSQKYTEWIEKPKRRPTSKLTMETPLTSKETHSDCKGKEKVLRANGKQNHARTVRLIADELEFREK